jgi:hypothetical protein
MLVKQLDDIEAFLFSSSFCHFLLAQKVTKKGSRE